jgi:hypothetical protein
MKALIATALALSFSGACLAAQEPTSTQIYLDIHNYPSTGSDGYTNSIASNNMVYSYRYSGVGGDGGDVVYNYPGSSWILVNMGNDPRYRIAFVGFTNDVHNQLSLASNTGTSAAIRDRNSLPQSANYKVTVIDTSTNAGVPCDPHIINK